MLPVHYPTILVFLLLVVLIEATYLQGTWGARWARVAPAVIGSNIVTMAVGYPLTYALYFVLDQALRFPQANVNLFAYQEWGPIWVCMRLFPNWSGLRQDMFPIFLIFITLLVPSYFISRIVKLKLVRWYRRPVFKGDIRPAIVNANRISYLFLAVAGCVLFYRLYASL